MADKPKTVRVRVLVVTDEGGNYNAAGWTGSPRGVKDALLDGFEPKGRERLTWVEAEVPLPEPEQVVQGVVVDGRCDHPWHGNPALITPCPACRAGQD